MQSIKQFLLTLGVICLTSAPLQAAEQGHGDEHTDTHGDKHSEEHGGGHGNEHGDEHAEISDPHAGRISIAPDIARAVEIKAAEAGPGALSRTITTYGVLTAAPEQVARVGARFPGLVSKVNVQLGDRVGQGDVLAEVESNDSLKKYSLRAPIAGVVISREVNSGEMAGEQTLFTIANLDSLWAEFKVFPGQRADVRVDQKVRVSAEGFEQQGTISHLLPSPDSSPYAIARVRVDNREGFLSPGLPVAGEVVVEEFAAPLVIDNRALQLVDDEMAVFAQEGDTYEVRHLELGRSDGRFTEVLGGLRADERYVVENSYLLKADIEKSGASHDH